MATSQPLGEPSSKLDELVQYELSASAVFSKFTASTAFELGSAIRSRILSLPAPQRRPAVISITSANGNQTLFHALTESGTSPDNEEWVRRKRNAVLRWGSSTWALRMKALTITGPSAVGTQIERAFAAKFGLKSSVPEGVPDDYAIHGGGFPIRVQNFDGLVGVIVVSGLKQEHDHQVIVEVVRDFLNNQ